MFKTKFNPAAPRHKVLLLTALGTLAGMGITPGANAGITFPCSGPGCQLSSVDTVVNGPDLDDRWTYEYTVNNLSIPGGDIIVDWEIPYFDDFDLMNIVSPSGWNHSIETIGDPNFGTGWGGVASWQDPLDPEYTGAGSPYTTGDKVFHWYCTDFGEGCFNNESDGSQGIFPDGTLGQVSSLGGFGFDAPFGPTDAPYQASWASLPVNTGDPPIPSGVGSPRALGAVPEPGTLTLAVLGVLGAFGIKRRRRSSS